MRTRVTCRMPDCTFHLFHWNCLMLAPADSGFYFDVEAYSALVVPHGSRVPFVDNNSHSHSHSNPNHNTNTESISSSHPGSFFAMEAPEVPSPSIYNDPSYEVRTSEAAAGLAILFLILTLGHAWKVIAKSDWPCLSIAIGGICTYNAILSSKKIH